MSSLLLCIEFATDFGIHTVLFAVGTAIHTEVWCCMQIHKKWFTSVCCYRYKLYFWYFSYQIWNYRIRISVDFFSSRLQVSASVKMRYSLFWHVTQCTLVVSYQRFGTTHRFHLKGSSSTWPLNLGRIGCFETSVIANLRCVTSQKTDDRIFFSF
jgi:hypothetical protein